MTTTNDLDLLDQVSVLPPKERLTAVIRQLTEHEGIERLSEALGYNTPGGLRVMLRMRRVPLRLLPGVASYLRVDVGVLGSLYLAQEAEPDSAEAIFQATRPRITDPELKIIHAAREAMMENDEDAADASLARDLRSGSL